MSKIYLIVVYIFGVLVLLSTAEANESEYLPGDVQCMVANIFYEARGESIKGQRAVFDVTLNRVDSSRWGNTICEVVWQPMQFSWTNDFTSSNFNPHYLEKNRKIYNEIKMRVIIWLSEKSRLTLADHYATNRTNKDWMKEMKITEVIGNHTFYKG